MRDDIKLHNKSDKPDNIVRREFEINRECEEIEKQLPSWLRGYFIYLKANDLPMTRLSYLREVRFFCNYLVSETELKEKVGDIKKLKPEDFDSITSVDINIFME